MADDIKNQVREHFVIVQLTLLSIIVALILENLLSSLWENNPMHMGSIEGWIALFEVSLVVLSAFATYTGFGLTLSFPGKRPRVIDFLMPFGLLFTMQIGIGFLMPEPIQFFLIAMGSASAIAGVQLIFDWRVVTTNRLEGGVPPAILQISIAVWDWLGAILISTGAIALPGACFFLVVAASAQLLGAAGTLRGWIEATR